MKVNMPLTVLWQNNEGKYATNRVYGKTLTVSMPLTYLWQNNEGKYATNRVYGKIMKVSVPLIVCMAKQ